ncbi:PREDICTED: aminoacyl tRNA synthase complex-interacting multifunctional protein 1 isoform X2 [Camelina sativa]|uniref:Aminoacyl tRNA synthase complex-interacting multifunctional protein 1 isoform X1 n=1 Tax=Camelina sativa TaxID=90675 RepID=A0ABM0YTX5_CAMSA|nr:PREDICTED: aminoacyl tRNA synthase complex-interacting multifunctional protein 1 isoform X1 [Camelina sativa]XP_010505818.1 PREDICTED: aminoacyl tRNA synthase complex-interacting multifunctional protein 1 isoform X2 [Camelina sativa]
MDSKTKQMILSALCKHFSLDPEPFLGGAGESDVKTLYSNVLKASGKEVSAQNNEVLKWLDFAEGFPAISKDCFAALEKLNVELGTKSVLLGNGLTPSAADVAVFSAVHSSVLGLSDSDKEKVPHVIRWINYIQNKEELSTLFAPIPVKLSVFDFEVSKSVPKVEANSNTKKATEGVKPVDKSEAQPITKKTEPEEPKKKATTEKDAKKEKKKPAETEPAKKDAELSVSLLDIQVGLIRKAWKHPSADSLLVEEIDVGEDKVRQVVSGLAKFCNPDDLTNRLVALITNVKPGKLRDVMSQGLVLCASSEDHSVVEPLLPPAGAKPGERVSFAGIEGKPEDVLNPKKKQLEKITPGLYTDENGVATYKGIPFMTSAGPCTSSIPKATIK